MANINRFYSVSKGLTFADNTAVFDGEADPRILGEFAPVGSVYLRKSSANVGELYYKHGLLDTDWTKVTGTTGGGGLGSGSVIDFLCSGNSSSTKNRWLYHSRDEPMDDNPAVFPFDCELIGMTYTNEDEDTCTDIRLYSVPEADSNEDAVLRYTWSINTVRHGRITDFGTTPITFSAGDRFGIYLKKVGSIHPHKPGVVVYFAITDATGGESYSNDDEELET